MSKVDLAEMLSGARARVEAETPVEERGLARFARLARKDARIRPDQDADLTALAKSLMRRRAIKAERITENTLIRVAIDLLLAHADLLRGSTEGDLRRSASAALRNSGTAQLPHSGTSASSDSRTPEPADGEPAVVPTAGVHRPADALPSIASRACSGEPRHNTLRDRDEHRQ